MTKIEKARATMTCCETYDTTKGCQVVGMARDGQELEPTEYWNLEEYHQVIASLVLDGEDCNAVD